MKKYDTLFIDLDDTLFDFSAASRQSFLETYELLEYGRFFESFGQFIEIYEPRNKELWQLYGRGEIDKAGLNRLRYNHPLEVVGHPDEKLAARFCTEALSRIPHKNLLIQGAKELLEYLYPKYDLYILSNGFRELQATKMATTGISQYFKRIILSEDIGINKPNRELFEYALKAADAKVEKSLMIGDAFETDIAGAANIGMEQIFFDRNGEGEQRFAPTYTVRALKEIKGVL